MYFSELKSIIDDDFMDILSVSTIIEEVCCDLNVGWMSFKISYIEKIIIKSIYITDQASTRYTYVYQF